MCVRVTYSSRRCRRPRARASARTGTRTSTTSRSATHPPGTPGFFADLDAYHFEKLHHLLRLVDFDAWRGRDVLDVGCGAGVEVVRFARGGARVVGVDICPSAPSALTRQNLAPAGPPGRPWPWPTARRCRFATRRSISCTPTASCSTPPTTARLVGECHRVLRPGGPALFQVYNRVSWLHAAVEGHEGAARARGRARCCGATRSREFRDAARRRSRPSRSCRSGFP